MTNFTKANLQKIKKTLTHIAKKLGISLSILIVILSSKKLYNIYVKKEKLDIKHQLLLLKMKLLVKNIPELYKILLLEHKSKSKLN